MQTPLHDCSSYARERLLQGKAACWREKFKSQDSSISLYSMPNTPSTGVAKYLQNTQILSLRFVHYAQKLQDPSYAFPYA
jgi:hypothetical protein